MGLIKMIVPMKVDFEDNFINFRYEGSDSISYKTQKNLFEEETGLTISNPDVDIPAYAIPLRNYGTHIECGHIIDNIIGFLRSSDIENVLLIIDFSEVIDVSNNFIREYIKFILSTKSKVISINQNTNINNAISQYVESIVNIQEFDS